MSAIQLWSNILGIQPKNFRKIEILMLEAVVFTRICEEIKKFFIEQRKEFFGLLKYTDEMKNNTIESEFLKLMILDILASGDYNMEGIACYANTHVDVVQEIISGLNNHPSAMLLQRILALHRSVRQDLYKMTLKKIIADLSVLE